MNIPVIKPSQITMAPNSQFSNLGQALMQGNISPEKGIKKPFDAQLNAPSSHGRNNNKY
jgi:hypothetical protein